MDGDLYIAGTVALFLFAACALADGLYFHLWRFRLFAWPDSRWEHATHTLRALLFPVIVYLAFARNVGGMLLWLTVAIVLVDFVVESWDVLIERRSRALLGGLPSLEYWLHTAAISTHTAALVLVASAKPAAAWLPGAPLLLPTPYPPLADWTAWLLIPGGVALGLLQVVLLLPVFSTAPVRQP